MRLESSKNTRKNFASGFIYRIAFLSFQFIIRTVIIRQLGAEYSGLGTLFSSVLQVLNLAELGVGNALVFSMYKPIVEDDSATLCALMRMYKLLYRIIGLIIFAMGLMLIPFIPHLISGDVPAAVNVYIIYFINLLSTIITYWLFSYRSSLLLAYQRNDVSNSIALGIEMIKFIMQIIILFSLKNYYLYLAVTLLTAALNNIIAAWFTHKMYPHINPVGNLPQQEARKIFIQIKDIFTAKLGGVITNSCDTIVVSSFLGLIDLTKYGNYYYIIILIRGFMNLIYQSARAGIGNKLILDAPSKTYRDFLSFSYICNFLIAICTNAFLCGIQPFMQLWVTKKWMYPNLVAVMFAIYLYVHESATVLITYKDAAGIWHKDRFRPLITAIANLSLNILMVQYIGIYGIILSTILSFLLIGVPWLIINSFKYIFKISGQKYIIILLRNAALTALSGFLAYMICQKTSASTASIYIFFKNIAISLVTTCIIYGGITYRFRDATNARHMIKDMLRK